MTNSTHHAIEMSVIIPTLGRSPHLRGLLERLQRQVTPFSFHVLVVANVPSQALRKLVNSMGNRRDGIQRRFEYLETGRLGVNLARNKGLERAQGSVVLFLDDDTILESDTFIAEHYERHMAHPQVAAIGGPYHLAARHTFWDQAYHDVAYEWLQRHRRGQNRTTQLLGGNLSLKRAIIEKHRWNFDDQIAFGGAESGLCQRMSLAGYDLLYFEDLAVGHAPEMTRLSFCRKAFLQGAGAHWRSKSIDPLHMRYVNELKNPMAAASTKVERARKLYAACFNYGWWSSPYMRGTTPNFNLLTLLVFTLRRLRIGEHLRSQHRAVYTALRSAWINRDSASAG